MKIPECYGALRFITMLTRARNRTLSWWMHARSHTSRSILVLSSNYAYVLKEISSLQIFQLIFFCILLPNACWTSFLIDHLVTSWQNILIRTQETFTGFCCVPVITAWQHNAQKMSLWHLWRFFWRKNIQLSQVKLQRFFSYYRYQTKYLLTSKNTTSSNFTKNALKILHFCCIVTVVTFKEAMDCSVTINIPQTLLMTC
jgi:hypothetical protein